jgi:hypothetical protein
MMKSLNTNAHLLRLNISDLTDSGRSALEIHLGYARRVKSAKSENGPGRKCAQPHYHSRVKNSSEPSAVIVGQCTIPSECNRHNHPQLSQRNLRKTRSGLDEAIQPA